MDSARPSCAEARCRSRPNRIPSFRSRCRWCGTTRPAADTWPAIEVIEGASKTVTKKWQGYPPENLNVLGKPLPPLPEVSIPRFTGKAQYASRVWFPDLLYAKFLTCPHPHARIKDIDTSAAEKMPGVRTSSPTRMRRSCRRANVARGRILPEPLPRELNLQGEVVGHRRGGDRGSGAGCRRRDQGRRTKFCPSHRC